MLKAITLCALAATACSEQSATATAPAANTVAAPSTPNDALLPVGGILSLATQLIVSAGTTPFLVDAVGGSLGMDPVQPYAIYGFWADPLAGKGWLQASGDGHFYAVPFSWNPRDTVAADLSAIIHQALLLAANGTGPKTNIDSFSHDQLGQFTTPKSSTMTPIETLIDQAETTEFDWALLQNTQQRLGVIMQPGSLISDPALFGHTALLTETWFDVHRTKVNAASSVKGTYAVSIDGKLSLHQFSATSPNTTDGSTAGYYVGPLSDQIVSDVRKQLGLTP